MSVYKEAVYAVNLIQKNSRQIWGDACDYGAPVKKGDEIWNWSKQLCDWYGVQGSRVEERYSTGVTVQQVIEYMPNEHTSSFVQRALVTYVSCHDSKWDGYIYITLL